MVIFFSDEDVVLVMIFLLVVMLLVKEIFLIIGCLVSYWLILWFGFCMMLNMLVGMLVLV